MKETSREKMLKMMEHIPAWKDGHGKLVLPNDILKCASDLLLVLGDALSNDSDRSARLAIFDTAKFLRVISEASQPSVSPEVLKTIAKA